MNITLKNVSYSAAMSQETSCFTATIYVDGVKAGDARNDGHGGSTFIFPHSLEKQIEVYAKTLPPRVFQDMTLSMDADMVIGDLLSDHLLLKEMRAKMKNTILFTRAGTVGVYQSNKLKPAQLTLSLQNLDRLKTTLKADKILNALPEAEALKLFKSIENDVEPAAQAVSRPKM
jgi:hypothetical protein